MYSAISHQKEKGQVLLRASLVLDPWLLELPFASKLLATPFKFASPLTYAGRSGVQCYES